jgi:crotonobetainyl-CoA:carnitine CoA-transferase CaiB-like acyl-CoA transferase
MKPLAGIKVVELGTYVAAPACPRMLGDWGADVLKIEPFAGDPMRRQAPVFFMPLLEDEPSAFDMCGVNKKFLSINLKHPEGMAAALKLIDAADVLVTNFRTKALEKLGLTYEILSRRNPRLVFAQMLGYGEKGPEKDTPGYDVTSYVARGGILGSFHERGTSPINEPNAFGDFQVSIALAAGICGALVGREKTGLGDKVTVALQHAAIYAMSTAVCSSQYGNTYPKSRRDVANPFNCTYRTSDDRWMIICLPDYDNYYDKFMRLIGREDLIGQEDICTIDAVFRLKTNTKVIDIISEALAKNTIDAWMRLFKENDVPCERGYTPDEILDDEQAWANDYLRKVKYPSGNERILTTTPIQFKSMGPPDMVLSKPLGFHTEEILKEYGYSGQDVEQLRSDKAIM